MPLCEPQTRFMGAQNAPPFMDTDTAPQRSTVSRPTSAPPGRPTSAPSGGRSFGGLSGRPRPRPEDRGRGDGVDCEVEAMAKRWGEVMASGKDRELSEEGTSADQPYS